MKLSSVLAVVALFALAPLSVQAQEPAAPCAPKLRLRGPLYAPGFAGLEAGVGEVLDEIARQFPKRCPGRALLIEAHATELATPELNQLLSGLRAISVREELVKRGLAREQLIAVGVGDTRPEVPPGTPDARELNRRITFRAVE